MRVELMMQPQNHIFVSQGLPRSQIDLNYLSASSTVR